MLDRYDQDLLLDYLEGELDQDRRAQIDAMLAADPQLAALLHEISLDRAALRSIPEAQAPSDLVHDVTSTLERRMLLDEPLDETGPIPITRGRGLDPAPVRSVSWGRVVGLTGLAASVALAAAIVVTSLDDPLERTANELAANPPAITQETADQTTAIPSEGLMDQPALSANLVEEASDAQTQRTVITDGQRGILILDQPDKAQLDAGIDRVALAHGLEPTDSPRPATASKLDLVNMPVAKAPLQSLHPSPTAAISVMQPSQQLLLITESPEVSRQQLFDFCVANGIPIVQQKEQHPAAQPRQTLYNNSETFALNSASPDKAATQNSLSYDDYALLINESQLDTLVRNLNNDVTIDRKRAGKASLISNQAAVLAKLPQEGKYQNDGQPSTVPTLQADQNDPLTHASDEPINTIEQQAIRLQLPEDLGSTYANTLNAYNLQRSQQQTGYAKLNQSDQAPAKTPPNTAMIQGGQSPTANPTQPADASSTTNLQHPPQRHDKQNKTEASTKPTPPTTPIDPVRGNWLSAHLPAVNATPLLLQWRADQSDKPTKLVPIRIKHAKPDKVNTLRKRQQAELANPTKEAQPTQAIEGIDLAEQVDPAPATATTSPAPAPADEVAE